MTPPRDTSSGRKRRSWAQWALDVALAVLSAGIAVGLHAEVVGTRSTSQEAAVVGAIVAGLHGGALIARRVLPLATLGALLITGVVYSSILGFPVFMLGPAVLFAAYSVAASGLRNQTVPALILVELMLVLLLMTGPSFPGFGSLFLLPV